MFCQDLADIVLSHFDSDHLSPSELLFMDYLLGPTRSFWSEICYFQCDYQEYQEYHTQESALFPLEFHLDHLRNNIDSLFATFAYCSDDRSDHQLDKFIRFFGHSYMPNLVPDHTLIKLVQTLTTSDMKLILDKLDELDVVISVSHLSYFWLACYLLDFLQLADVRLHAIAPLVRTNILQSMIHRKRYQKAKEFATVLNQTFNTIFAWSTFGSCDNIDFIEWLDQSNIMMGSLSDHIAVFKRVMVQFL